MIPNFQKLLSIVTRADQERKKYIGRHENKPFVDMFTRECPPDKFPVIMDLGCGVGSEVLLLLENGYEFVLGVNYNEEPDPKIKLEVDDKLFGNALFIEADFHNLSKEHYFSVRYEQYDAIFCLQTLEHALNPIMALLEIRAVLKDEGILFLDLPSVNPDMLKTVQHSSVLLEIQWEALFKKTGFDIYKNYSMPTRYHYFLKKHTREFAFKEYYDL